MSNVKFLLSEKEDIRTTSLFILREIYDAMNSRNYIYRELPALKNVHLLERKEALKKIESEIHKVYKAKHDALEASRKRFEILFNSFDFARVEKIMGRKCRRVSCFVSILDINAINEEGRYFQVYYKTKDKKALQIIVHELSHFIFYDSYLKLFANKPLNKQKFWDLSEIIAQIIQREFDFGESTYRQHKRILPLFWKLWKENKKEDFNIFLNKAVELMKNL